MTLEAYKKMRIEYNRLFNKLKKNKITQKDFRDNAGISGATMQKLLHNGNITTEIICRICDYFQCMPDEIMEFIPEADYENRREAKANIEQQIENLQRQLKEI